MKELKLLNRLLGALEAVHLFVLSCCLALPLFFLVPEFSPEIELLWALGAALAVTALNVACRHIERPLHRLLLGLGLLLLCGLLLPTWLLRILFAIVLGIQILIVTVLPRPDGKFVLTVPKFYYAIAPLLLYGLSWIYRSDLMQLASVTLAAVFAVNTLLHFQAKRLLNALCDRGSTALSDESLVTLNRRLMLAFCLLGALIVIAVPYLWSLRQPAKDAFELPDNLPAQVQETEASTVEPHTDWQSLSSGRPIDFNPLLDTAELLLLLLALALVALVVTAVVLRLKNLESGNDKHGPPKKSGFSVEALPEKETRTVPQEERSGSWARRIRRLYARLIHAKVDPKKPLAALSPRELEQAAGLEGSARDMLHALYEKARYSGNSCEKSDFLEAKSAAQQLKRGETG